MRFANRSDVIEVLSTHPDGLTARDITRNLWPSRQDYDYFASLAWTKGTIQDLRRAGLVEKIGVADRCYIWGLKR